ncbi:MAG: hypothetical protein OEW39_00605 [Deltaproteobacteria bacterium]|nr:hypothetical protein [Deltaproteobacteria bacterium]
MMEGFIRRLDPESRTVFITARDGKEHTVTVPETAAIEIIENATMGTIGGKFKDLEVGFLVHVDVHDVHENGTCHCSSLVCIS